MKTKSKIHISVAVLLVIAIIGFLYLVMLGGLEHTAYPNDPIGWFKNAYGIKY